jgi:hypothetical protein
MKERRRVSVEGDVRMRSDRQQTFKQREYLGTERSDLMQHGVARRDRFHDVSMERGAVDWESCSTMSMRPWQQTGH